MPQQQLGACEIRFRQVVVQLQRLCNKAFDVLEGYVGLASRPQPAMGQCEVGPTARKLRIQFRCTPEQVRGHLHAVLSLAPKVESTHQIQLIGIDVVGGSPSDVRALLRSQLDLERSDDGMRDLVLHGEDVAELPVIAFRPQVMAGPSVDQLRGNPDRLPALRTLPSTMCVAPSWRAIWTISMALPLSAKLVLRAATAKLEIFERSVMMSSERPSPKYSCSGSPLKFVKGRTAIVGLSG